MSASANSRKIANAFSANFSKRAEEHNIELGLRVRSRSLTEMMENELLDAEAVLFEWVGAAALKRRYRND